MKTGEVVKGTIEQQTRLTLIHISTILGGAGGDLNDVVKCTCQLKDIGDFNHFDAAYSEFFSGIRPARTVQSVLWGAIKIIKIDAIARLRTAILERDRPLRAPPGLSLSVLFFPRACGHSPPCGIRLV